MKIKKRLRINAGVSLLITFCIGFVLFLSLHRLHEANISAKIAGEIVTSAFERDSLRNDYIRNNSGRAKDQWFSKNEQIGNLLQSAPAYFQGSEDRNLIGRMMENQESFREIFSAIAANRERSDVNAGLAALLLEAEERLLNQLNMKGYEVVIQGRSLIESSRETGASALRLAGGSVISAFLLIIGEAIINLGSLSREITDRVNRLRDGAVVIGAGDLKHRIDITGDDEFAELSEAFNAMTAKLSGLHHDLKVEIEERKLAEEQIKASLAEKEAMLREIHHRVKNNLQVISSLISLQADNLADERIREEFNTVCDRIRSMAMIHEKLYQTGNLAQLNFADYVTSLLQYLWNSYDVLAEKVRLNLVLAPVALSIEKAIPCGLILNELASNILKHAFPHNSCGEATVSLEYNTATSTVRLRVCDSGVGLPTGLDWRQSNSLGLRLVEILAGQLRGTVETGTGHGADFRITFSANEFQS